MEGLTITEFTGTFCSTMGITMSDDEDEKDDDDDEGGEDDTDKVGCCRSTVL